MIVQEDIPYTKEEVKSMVRTIHDLREKVSQLGWHPASELPPEEGEYIAINNGMPGVFWVDYLEPFGWCVEIMGAHEVVNVKWWCYPPKED
jgi:hypothetical protein